MAAIALLNTGNTAWVIMATILALLMSIPGAALFYGGLSKRKNVLNTMFLTLIAFSIIAVIWVCYGYQATFGSTLSGIVGIPTNLFMNGITLNSMHGSIPTILFVTFQLAFAALTGVIISGSIVGRMKTNAWVIYIIAWLSLIYIPICHWVWGGGWLMSLGVLDFAGGTVVEINCGLSALALAVVLGNRREKVLIPHNLGYSVLGAGFLFFGWLGFNGGSALTAGALASSAILTTVVSACMALIVWCIIDNMKVGKPTVLGAITGLIVGLVAITPAAGFVDVPAALIIGAVASCISYFAIYTIKEKFGYDDALDVFGVHGCAGIWGTFATGIFASPLIRSSVSGLIYGNPGQLLIQALAVLVTVVYVFVVSYLIAKIIDKTIGLRVERRVEIEGLDTNLHEESGYNF